MCNIDSYRIPVRNSPIFPPCITVKLAFMQQTTEEISLQVRDDIVLIINKKINNNNILNKKRKYTKNPV